MPRVDIEISYVALGKIPLGIHAALLGLDDIVTYLLPVLLKCGVAKNRVEMLVQTGGRLGDEGGLLHLAILEF
jgi:hypothetical protein